MLRYFSIFVLMSVTACSTTEVKKNVSDTPGAVASAPVKALNVKKKEIPESLKELGNPYDVAGDRSCAAMKSEIDSLTEFAGPDWDSDDHYTKKGRNAGELADAVLPYGGLVRFISGATEHEKKLAAALNYASVRRSFLKAQSLNSGC